MNPQVGLSTTSAPGILSTPEPEEAGKSRVYKQFPSSSDLKARTDLSDWHEIQTMRLCFSLLGSLLLLATGAPGAVLQVEQYQFSFEDVRTNGGFVNGTGAGWGWNGNGHPFVENISSIGVVGGDGINY